MCGCADMQMCELHLTIVVANKFDSPGDWGFAIRTSAHPHISFRIFAKWKQRQKYR